VTKQFLNTVLKQAVRKSTLASMLENNERGALFDLCKERKLRNSFSVVSFPVEPLLMSCLLNLICLLTEYVYQYLGFFFQISRQIPFCSKISSLGHFSAEISWKRRTKRSPYSAALAPRKYV
jgi:hypothetical protein